MISFPIVTNFLRQSMVAIDPGSINIKVVEGSKKKDKLKISNFGMASLSSNLPSDTSHIFEENLAYILEKIFQSAKIKSKKFFVIIPAIFSFFTDFTLPRIAEKSLPNAIKFEAQRFLPIKTDEAIFHYRYFLQELAGEEPKYLVFAVATPANYQEKMKNVAALLKGKLNGLLSEIFALEKYFLNDLGSYFVVNLGHGYSLFLGIHQGRVIFAKRVNFGGSTLISSIAQVLKVNQDRAMLHLREKGFYFPPEEAELSTIVDSFLKNVSLETKKSLTEFENKIVSKINKIYWTGGVAIFKGFLERISSNLSEYSQTILNPADYVTGNQFQQLAEKTSIFSTNVGALL